MARPEKVAEVEEIKKRLETAKVVVLTDFTGLNVHQISELRNSLREQNAEYKVFKNTLIRIAAQDKNLECADDFFTGPTALAVSYDDEVVVPKILAKFSKQQGCLKVKGGILQGRVIASSLVKELASLPSFEILVSKLMGSMEAPVSGFANVLAGPIRGLVTVLDGIVKQKSFEN